VNPSISSGRESDVVVDKADLSFITAWHSLQSFVGGGVGLGQK